VLPVPLLPPLPVLQPEPTGAAGSRVLESRLGAAAGKQTHLQTANYNIDISAFFFARSSVMSRIRS
jgi:hypothetical protein